MHRDDLTTAYRLLSEQIRQWDPTITNATDLTLKEAVGTLNIPMDLKSRLSEELWGWGPIASLIEDNSVTEIIVNGPDKICFEKEGTLHKHEILFLNTSCYENFIHFVCSLTGSNLTVTRGFAEGRWQNFRIHLVSQSLTRAHDIVTLRRLGTQQWSLKSLEEAGFLSGRACEFLRAAVKDRKTVLVCGPTGAGKTSLLLALIGTIPENQRVILLEETSELTANHSSCVGLEARTSPSGELEEITLERLVKESLRMRPDRLVVGEVRGREAKDLVLALSTGHSGGLTTLHAKSAADGLARLEVLVQMGAPTWSLQTIRRILFSSIQLILTVGKTGEGFRSLLAIHEVASLEDQGITLDPIHI